MTPRARALAAGLLAASPAFAAALAPPPLPRPAAAVGPAVTPPPARPAAQGPVAAPTAADAAAPPPIRPARPPARVAAEPGGEAERYRGGLCGDRRLIGARLPAIEGRGGCGVARPVRLSAAAGLRIEPPVAVNCATARATADWVERAVLPAARAELGAAPVALRAFAGYSCRTRNNRPGGRLSEHARGNAIDIGGVVMADGTEIALGGNWTGARGGFFRAIWRGACGPFGTVLGPDADRWHRDHFHLDVARYRSGPYCR